MGNIKNVIINGDGRDEDIRDRRRSENIGIDTYKNQKSE